MAGIEIAPDGKLRNRQPGALALRSDPFEQPPRDERVVGRIAELIRRRTAADPYRSARAVTSGSVLIDTARLLASRMIIQASAGRSPAAHVWCGVCGSMAMIDPTSTGVSSNRRAAGACPPLQKKW
jgi:hypothetical protein